MMKQRKGPPARRGRHLEVTFALYYSCILYDCAPPSRPALCDRLCPEAQIRFCTLGQGQEGVHLEGRHVQRLVSTAPRRVVALGQAGLETYEQLGGVWALGLVLFEAALYKVDEVGGKVAGAQACRRIRRDGLPELDERQLAVLAVAAVLAWRHRPHLAPLLERHIVGKASRGQLDEGDA